MLNNNQFHNRGDNSYIHHYYMNIINSIPDSVYWVDINCNLLGCNNNFIKLLGLNHIKEFKGTPYQHMLKAHWDEQRVEAFKLDDMNAIFSKESSYNNKENPITDHANNRYYFRSNRVPMIDENKHCVGLIVVLTKIDNLIESEDQTKKTKQSPKTKILPNVLMIEDNLITQNIEKALLTSLNCQVDVAASGEQALKLFNPGKYDLVFMDIGLEDTSGYVVAKQLRHLEKNTQHHVPIIALTSYAADIVKYDCEQYSMEGAITKPLTNEQAQQIINHYVHHINTTIRGLKHT